MSIDAQKKRSLVSAYGSSEKDTGSVGAQCAILTDRINYLTNHLSIHKKDFASRRGLILLVGKRRRLTGYLKNKDPEAYDSLIKKLNIRK